MNVGSRIRHHRELLGISQVELAKRSGVSRQSIGAIEGGANLPRVDVAIELARALGVGVDELFGSSDRPVDVVTGQAPADGKVRLGRVGDQLVTTPVSLGAHGYESADAISVRGSLETISRLAPGLVVAGCEPGLAIVEQTIRESGTGATWVATSTHSALESLDAGRAHAAVAHGKKSELDRMVQGRDVSRIRLARWRVGLAAPHGSKPGWQHRALEGRVAVAQREDGASIQQVFRESLDSPTGPVPGPLATTHLEAAHLALWAGIPALTFEPAARSLDLDFHPLATHVVEVWFPREFNDEPVLTAALNLITSERFSRSLMTVGGYDLSDLGKRVA